MNDRAKEARCKMRKEASSYTENAEMNLQWLKMEEKDMRCQRDEAIEQAKDMANHAHQVISNGSAAFPSRARARYPKLCASIGEVTYPMNDSTSGCRIQANCQVAGQCASIASQQLFLMTSMQSVVATKVYQLQASLEKIKRSITAEHHSTFNRKRSAVWWSSLEQDWFSSPTDRRELLLKKFRNVIAFMKDAHIRIMKETKKSVMMASPHLAVLDVCRIC